MKQKEFREVLMERLQERLGEAYDMQKHDVVKINGIERLGIGVAKRGKTNVPIIYVDDFYEQFKNGESLEKILERVLFVMAESEKKEFSKEELEILQDWEKAKNLVEVRLINTEKNKDLLKNIPFVPFLNLSAVFFIKLDETENGMATAWVNQKLQKLYGVNTEILYQQAVQNMENQEKIMSLGEIFGSISGAEECCGDMYILTNRSSTYGASLLLSEQVREKLSVKFQGEDLFLLPSSVHEWILVPVKGAFEPEQLLETVKAVNAEEVGEKEFLADTVYLFHADTKKVEVAANKEK